MVRFIFYLLLLFLAVAEAKAEPCTIDALRARHPDFCESRWNTRPLSVPQTRALFTEVRSLMREVILQGRQPNQLTDQEASLLSRIETTELGEFTDCGSGSTAINASYRGHEHRVFLCDNLRFLPLPALVGMIGHEIGHSADSCHCQTPHLHAPHRERVQVPQGRLDRATNGPQLLTALQSGSGPLHIVSSAFFGNNRLWQDWVAQGTVQVRGVAMTLADYPLNRVRMCLANQAGLFNGRNSTQLARHRDDQGCHSMDDYETMADVWGAYALERYFERHPELRGRAALGMFENRKHELCSPKGYPETERKLAEIWMSRPATAQALGCEPASAHRCLDNYSTRSRQPDPPCETGISGSANRTGVDTRWLRDFLEAAPTGQ